MTPIALPRSFGPLPEAIQRVTQFAAGIQPAAWIGPSAPFVTRTRLAARRMRECES